MTIPILPGLMPVTNPARLARLTELTGVEPPAGLALRGRRLVRGIAFDRRDRLERHHPRALQAAHIEVTHDREEIGVGTADMIDTVEHGEPAIGLLDQLIGVVGCRPRPQKPGAHVRFVGHDLPGHPRRDADPPLDFHPLSR